VDLLGYAPEEIEAMRHDYFLRRALLEGKVIYARSRPGGRRWLPRPRTTSLRA